MPALRMNSPTAPYFRNKLSTQIRRVLPLYLTLLVLIVFFGNANFFTSPLRAASKYKRDLKYKRHLSKSEYPIFPRKIWQTWKTGPLMFEERDWTTARTWPDKNPAHRYEVLTDDNEMAYVEWHYGPHGLNRPDLVELYRSITAVIIKADLLRYMIMYAEGGVYADIDVESLRPVSRWVPDRYDEEDIDMVIGLEIDQPHFKDHPILGPKSQSFCQWTFMCKPHLPVMMRLIEEIQDWITKIAKKQGVSISAVVLDFDDVISGTGPSAFTTAVLEQMNAQRGHNKQVTWDMFHDLAESKLVSRFLVLNVEAFAAGQGHSDSGNHNARGALVKHHYHASGWPSKHSRKNHPMYGEVEKCNWDPWCVAEWDKNVEEWKKLTEVEQKQRIADKAEADRLQTEALDKLGAAQLAAQFAQFHPESQGAAPPPAFPQPLAFPPPLALPPQPAPPGQLPLQFPPPPQGQLPFPAPLPQGQLPFAPPQPQGQLSFPPPQPQGQLPFPPPQPQDQLSFPPSPQVPEPPQQISPALPQQLPEKAQEVPPVSQEKGKKATSGAPPPDINAPAAAVAVPQKVPPGPDALPPGAPPAAPPVVKPEGSEEEKKKAEQKKNSEKVKKAEEKKKAEEEKKKAEAEKIKTEEETKKKKPEAQQGKVRR